MSRMSFQPRFDEERGIYRDCKWCGGKGCLACPGEAEKEYKRQFPDGPKPIAVIPLEKPLNLDSKEGQSQLIDIIKKFQKENDSHYQQ
jgi:hypothetical protein